MTDGQKGGEVAVTPRLLSIPQTAQYLGRTVRSVEGLVLAKAFPVVRADRRVMLDRKDLDKWIEGNKE